jgi:hypothetical protein
MFYYLKNCFPVAMARCKFTSREDKDVTQVTDCGYLPIYLCVVNVKALCP